jgi:hypothetical protein
MNRLLKGLIAGYGARKLGGGCLSTIVIFVIIWMVLGQCSNTFKPNENEKNNTIQTEIRDSAFDTPSFPAKEPSKS